MQWGKRLIFWLVCAALLLLPTSISLNTLLIGSSEIDVWNHAWGYWFVHQSILEGSLPLETTLIGSPSGGSLYFIDTPGAIAGYLLTSLFGPAVAYNIVLLVRISLTGFAAQLLTEQWSQKGLHSWIAGLAMMTLPFLLCELANGISEVCAIQWAIFTLWAASRCQNEPTKLNWILVGVFQGLTITSTFYYGMAIGLLLVFLFVFLALKHLRQDDQFSVVWIWGPIAAGILSILVAAPYAGAFWYTLQSDSRLVLRDTSLNDQLLRHNAVDPRIYLQFGFFQSVNLLEKYGEPFIHTAYLRWSLIPAAIYACTIKINLRIWMFIAILSFSLGLGPYLWWGEDWVTINDQLISLPFDWLRSLLPQIAITHPLRLSIGGQIIITCLGIIGLNSVISQSKKQWHKLFWALAAVIICSEGMWGSSASWPIPSSDAKIPSIYEQLDHRSVLDLPAEAGTSMKTSQYFWFQTKHGKPIPYTPDARLGSTRDLETFKNFIASDGVKEQPQNIPTQSQLHMRNLYGLVVLHSTLDPSKTADYLLYLSEAFGEPEKSEDRYYWRLNPLKENEKAPDTKTTSSPYSNKGETIAPLVDCNNPEKAIIAHLENTLTIEEQQELKLCEDDLAIYCRKRCKSSEISTDQAKYCIDIFSKYPSSDDVYAIMHLFRNENDEVKKKVATKLYSIKNSYNPNLPTERFNKLAQEQNPEVKKHMLRLIVEQ
jgi:hypothetical protein